MLQCKVDDALRRAVGMHARWSEHSASVFHATDAVSEAEEAAVVVVAGAAASAAAAAGTPPSCPSEEEDEESSSSSPCAAKRALNISDLNPNVRCTSPLRVHSIDVALSSSRPIRPLSD